MKTRLTHYLTAALLSVVFTAELAAQNHVVTYQGLVQSSGSDFTGTGQFKFALVTSVNLNSRATAEATVSGEFVTIITPIDIGSNYLTAPAVTIVGGGGSGATATASISNGMVIQYMVTAPGSGYISTPTVVVEPPPENLIFTTYWSNDGTSVDGSEPVDAVNVQVTNGLFAVSLGDTSVPSMAAFEADTFAQPNLELRIWFDDGLSGFAALSPTQPLAAAPYALKVPDGAVTRLGTPDGSDTSVVRVDDLGRVGIRRSPRTSLDVDGNQSNATIIGVNKSETGAGILGEARGGPGVDGWGGNNEGPTIGVRGQHNSPDGYGVFGHSYNFSGYAGYFDGRFHVKHYDSDAFAGWPVSIENESHAAHQAGMRVSDDGFFDVTNDALNASPNFARLNNTGNWTVVSDRRLKRDIQPLSGALDRAMALEPVSFSFKNGDARSGNEQIGFIAQDVRKQFPSLVTDGDVLTLNYAGLSVVAISALQELNQKVDERGNRLEQELKRRDAENVELKRELDELKELVHSLLAKSNGGAK